MTNEEKEWPSANRFVAVLDVMGFKDFVLKNSHETVVETMRTIKNVKETLIDGTNPGMRMDTNLRSVQFSDSIFVFSLSDTAQDLLNILHQCRIMMAVCITQKIPMKGAISCGKITAEFSNSILLDNL